LAVLFLLDKHVIGDDRNRTGPEIARKIGCNYESLRVISWEGEFARTVTSRYTADDQLSPRQLEKAADILGRGI